MGYRIFSCGYSRGINLFTVADRIMLWLQFSIPVPKSGRWVGTGGEAKPSQQRRGQQQQQPLQGLLPSSKSKTVQECATSVDMGRALRDDDTRLKEFVSFVRAGRVRQAPATTVVVTFSSFLVTDFEYSLDTYWTRF